MGGNKECFENFERNKYLKKLPSMQKVKVFVLLQPLVEKCAISYVKY